MHGNEICVCCICICGQHRCHRDSLCNSPSRQRVDSRTGNLLQTSDSGTGRCRRQWETSAEHLHKIYRSLSNFDISARNATPANVRDGLPRLKRSSFDCKDELKSLAQKKMTHVQKNYSDNVVTKLSGPVRRNINDGKGGREEWAIVCKPVRRKPKDNLRLEGHMDLETTNKCTYEVAAKEIAFQRKQHFVSEHANGNHASKQIPMSVSVSGVARPDLRPVVKNHRPRTCLRIGGEGCYKTISSDSFKRFVVVDGNNNQSNWKEGNEQRTTKINTCRESESKRGVKNAIGLPKVPINESIDKQPNDSLVKRGTDPPGPAPDVTQKVTKNTDSQLKVHEPEVNKAAKSSEASNVRGKNEPEAMRSDSVRKEDHVAKRVDILILDDVHGKSQSQFNKHATERPSVRAERKLDNEIVSKDGNFIAAGNPKTVANIRNDGKLVAVDMAISKERKERKERKEGHRTRSGRARHHSLPRTHKHKNESQLKLDGAMDFTTSNSCYKDNTHSLLGNDQSGANGIARRFKRDMFRASAEVDLFRDNDHQTKLESVTTYQSQFRDKFYCPVLDLNTYGSRYKYKSEFGGHRFYVNGAEREKQTF